MNEKLRGLEHRPSGDPKEPDAELVRALLGDKASQAFIKAMGGDGEAPPTGDAGNAVDLTKISPEALTTRETERSLNIWDFRDMVRWVKEELQEANITDPEAWVDEHCEFTDEGVIGKGDWWLDKVTTLNSFPKLIDHEGGLYLDSLISAEHLDLTGLGSLQSLGLDSLISAEHLDLTRCSNLQQLGLNSLTSAEHLDLTGCSGLQWLGLNSLTSAEHLDLTGCSNLQQLRLGSLTSAEHLDLTGLSSLQWLELDSLTSAEHLDLTGCSNLQQLGIPNLTSVKHLDLTGCSGLRSLHLSNLTSAEHLDLTGCSGLKSLHLESLTLVEGFKAPDNMQGTRVYLPHTTPRKVKEFFESRNADVRSILRYI